LVSLSLGKFAQPSLGSVRAFCSSYFAFSSFDFPWNGAYYSLRLMAKTTLLWRARERPTVSVAWRSRASDLCLATVGQWLATGSELGPEALRNVSLGRWQGKAPRALRTGCMRLPILAPTIKY